MIESALCPIPQQVELTGESMDRPRKAAVTFDGDDTVAIADGRRLADDLLDVAGVAAGFGGADYAWTPQSPAPPAEGDLYRERYHGRMLTRMKHRQKSFAKADERAIRADTGYEVHQGFYLDVPLVGRPVAPTAAMPPA